MPGDSGYEDVFHRFSQLMAANDQHLGVNSVMLGHTTTSPQDPPPTKPGGSGHQPPGGGPPPTAPGGACSFTSDTPVTTDHGQQAIGSLHEGDKVQAYNPKTGKMESEPVLHVWKNTDHDLIDLTITTTEHAANGKTTQKSEVLHTTSEHPFLTKEQGFVPAGSLHKGMHILRADGSTGTVTDWKVVPGTKVMYNLEVAQDHTFTVGDGQWVVHNKCGPKDYQTLRDNLAKAGRPLQPGQNPHHVIPCALEGHGLVQATDGLFDKNAAYNGRPLWNKSNQPEALSDGEPYHWFHSRYNSRVRGLMDAELARLNNAGMLTPENAFTSLLNLIDFLNMDIDQQGLASVLAGQSCLVE